MHRVGGAAQKAGRRVDGLPVGLALELFPKGRIHFCDFPALISVLCLASY